MTEGDQSHLLPYAQRADFKVARAPELTGSDRRLYRFLEIVPGVAAWVTIIGMILASIYAPFFAAYFVIAFAIYWVLKTIFLSYHVRYNWKRLRHHMELDWKKMVERLSFSEYQHLVIFPFYNEPLEVIEGAIKGLVNAKYDPKKIIVVLAAEARAGEEASAMAYQMEEK